MTAPSAADHIPSCPEFQSNLISQWIYEWVRPLIWKGFKKPLQLEDLYSLDAHNQATNLASEFERIWKEERQSNPSADSVSLSRVLWRQFGPKYAAIGIFHLLQAAANIGSPLVLNQLVLFVEQSARRGSIDPIWPGWVFAVVFFLLQLLSTLFLSRYFYYATTIAMRIRSCLTAVTYRKTIKLSALARQEYSSGLVLNIISSDLSRLEQAVWQGHYLWSGPLQITIILALLILFIGPSALLGFGLLIILIPVQIRIFMKLGALRKGVAQVSDKRIRLTQEFMQGMKIIKFFAWEISFRKKAMDLRTEEVKKIRHLNVLTAILMGIATSFPVLASVVSFIVYASTGGNMNPAIVFAALAFFNMLRFPMIILPSAIRLVMESRVAIRRLEGFLNAEELVDNHPDTVDPDMAIEIENASFQWEVLEKKKDDEEQKKNQKQAKKNGNKEEQPKTTKSETEKEIPMQVVPKEPVVHLKDINLKIKKGSLVAVVGPVGSGKSTLINAILGETKQLSGNIRVKGSIGYSLQQPWIQNGTLRKNVLFGNPYDETKYSEAVYVSALEKDLEWLPAGSDTLLGEKGVQISGGQKARVSLARIVYCSPDIVLLDDPISAVDVHVGKHIFKHCIKDALRDKTVILVTHHLNYVKDVDQIIFFKDGQIKEQGTYSELMKLDGECARLIKSYAGSNEEEKNGENETRSLKPRTEKKGKSAEMQQEERVIGGVSWSVYRNYLIAAGGIIGSSIAAFLIIFNQSVRIGTDLWLTGWTLDYFPALDDMGYSLIYLAWGLSQGILSAILGSALAFAFARASNIFHANALLGVFRAPVSFFDLTPLGRIMNRFSRDTDTMDTLLPGSIQMFLNVLGGLLGTLVLMVIYIPILLAPLAVLSVLYGFLLVLYLRTSREVKRIESISRSPVIAHFSETMTGLSTVRAYCRQNQFVNESDDYIDVNNRTVYIQLAVQRWLSVRLESIGALICFFVAILSIYLSTTLSASIVGLVLSYSLQVTVSMNFVVRQAVEVEVNANSIERLNHYASNLEHEAEYEIESNRPPAEWPHEGKVEVDSLEIRYAPTSDPVIKGISFSINAKEKVGVVGRTGAGKSTITLALFRLLEPYGGSIKIDGIETKSIGLHDLRRGLSIIPQDPVLFSGTIRSNLDPFGHYSDLEIWDVLASVNMKEAINKIPEKLEGKVDSNGENFSTGQRQLLCLARAMLKKPKILIMDEATANVDMESDHLIQTCLRKDFQNSTIITIAHRLNTVIDYDRILVLDQGKIAEYDSPAVLVDKEGGLFKQMIDQSGPSNAKLLREMAKEKKALLDVSITEKSQ